MTTEHSKYDLEAFEDGGIVWGAKIDASNYGKPLSWLKDNEEVYCHWDDHTSSGPYHVDCVHGWGEGFQIRLPADHWAYPVIAKGFTPWAGGDWAPVDWDPGSPVLFRNGDQLNQGEWAWGQGDGDYIIIGYRKRVEGDLNAPDMVYLPVMTMQEARDKAEAHCEDYEWDNGYVQAIRDLGLINLPAPIEAFEVSHGGLDNNQRDIVEAFIAWQSAQ